MSTVNKEKQYLFISIPRTASGSVGDLVGGGGHLTAQEWKRKIDKAHDLDWGSLYKFAFVRHPFSRFQSAYYHLGIHNEHDINEYVAAFGVAELVEKERALFRPQSDFVLVDGEIGVDFLGMFERLADDWQEVAIKLGIEEPLPYRNESPKEKTPLDKNSKRILAEFYADDFRLLHYEK